MTIPTDLTELQFRKHIAPHLSKANHGYVSEQPLYKLRSYAVGALYAHEASKSHLRWVGS